MELPALPIVEISPQTGALRFPALGFSLDAKTQEEHVPKGLKPHAKGTVFGPFSLNRTPITLRLAFQSGKLKSISIDQHTPGWPSESQNQEFLVQIAQCFHEMFPQEKQLSPAHPNASIELPWGNISYAFIPQDAITTAHVTYVDRSSFQDQLEFHLGDFYRQHHFWIQASKQTARHASARLISEKFVIEISKEDGQYGLCIGCEAPGSIYDRNLRPLRDLLVQAGIPCDLTSSASMEELAICLKLHADQLLDEKNFTHDFLTHRLPGFRLSPRDAAVLAFAACATLCLLFFHIPFAWLLPFVVAHFFLFCNLLRPGTRLELLWVGWLVAQIAGWAAWKGEIALLPVLAVQTPATLAVTFLALRSPDYHGIFWRKINPGWKDNQ